MQDVPL